MVELIDGELVAAEDERDDEKSVRVLENERGDEKSARVLGEKGAMNEGGAK